MGQITIQEAVSDSLIERAAEDLMGCVLTKCLIEEVLRNRNTPLVQKRLVLSKLNQINLSVGNAG